MNSSGINDTSSSIEFPLCVLEKAFGNCSVKLSRCDDNEILRVKRPFKTCNDASPAKFITISFKNIRYTDFTLILMPESDGGIKEGWSNAADNHTYYAHLTENIEVHPEKLSINQKPIFNDNRKLTKLKNGRYECSYCRNTFSDRSNAARHIRERRCPLMSKLGNEQTRDHNFGTNKSVVTTCTNQKGEIYKCTTCDRTFSSKYILQRHIVTRHIGHRKFKCSVCNMAFKRKDALKDHSFTHDTEKAFACSICGAKFRRTHTLNKHMHFHSGKPRFQCRLCGKKFFFQNHLPPHYMAEHAGEKLYECSYCKGRFISSSTLKKHIGRFHRNPKRDSTLRKHAPRYGLYMNSKPDSEHFGSNS